MARLVRVLRQFGRLAEGVGKLLTGNDICRDSVSRPWPERVEVTKRPGADTYPEEATQRLLSRKEIMLRTIDVRAKTGLEIGPLTSPVVSRQEGEIFYVDHLSTADLQKKYSNDPKVDLDAICSVDFVWGSQTLRECLGREVDYIVASHVAEHVPDLAGWLAECQDALTEDGILSLALPDKRFTFDHRRGPSGPAALVEAFCQRRRIPSAGQVYDHFSNYFEIDAAKAWSGLYPDCSDSEAQARSQRAFVAAMKSTSGEYIDSHCWVFTCESFLELLRTTFELGMNRLRVVEFHATRRNQLEFYVALQKLGKDLSDDECRRLQLESCVPCR